MRFSWNQTCRAGILLWSVLTGSALAVGQTTSITIDTLSPGLVFDGYGCVSAGAASRLLIDYSEPYRSDILDYLFKPKFALSFHHLKVEIGGGFNSTCGAEPSHIRTREELLNPVYTRGYEFWLMRMARDRNPDILLSGLPWSLPSWVKEHSQDHADYLVKWILGAKSQWNCDIDYIAANRNEVLWQAADGAFAINYLKPSLNAGVMSKVKIIVGDEHASSGWHIATMLTPQLLAVTDVIGTHYAAQTAPDSMKKFGKPIWSSEDGSSTRNWTGALAMVRKLNGNYIKGKITSTLSWTPLNSYYDHFLCAPAGILEAKSPWSGYYAISPLVWGIAHVTQFCGPGWRYIDAGCGVIGNLGNYVTLKKPGAGGDYSIIIASDTVASAFAVTVSAGLSSDTVHVWKSTATAQFIRQADIVPAKGAYYINLEPNAIYSFTTTTGQTKGTSENPAPQNRPFPFPYTENFDAYKVGDQPKYLSDMHGTFEIARFPGENTTLRQVVLQSGSTWLRQDFPYTVFGGYDQWTDYYISVKGLIESAGDIKLYGRIQGNFTWTTREPAGYSLVVDQAGAWRLKADSVLLVSGTKTPFSANTWHRLKIHFFGHQISAFIDDAPVAAVTDTSYNKGFAALGTGWNGARFDSLWANTADAPTGVLSVSMPSPPYLPYGNLFKCAGNRIDVPSSAHGTLSAVTVFNCAGERLRGTVTGRNEIKMDRDLGLSEGIYFVRIIPADRGTPRRTEY